MRAAAALRYPRRYTSALRTRRRIREAGRLPPADAFEFGRSLEWYGGRLRATQAREEILWLLDLLEREQPRTVLEIGTDEGGTLFLWSQLAAPDALLVAVDMRPLGRLGRRSPYALVRRGFAREQQRVELLMPRDSHDPATVEEVGRLLEGRRVDFLFIDGDHAYDGVKCDYELFSPLVRPGGLIALHDVAAVSAPGVVRLWGELCQTLETVERVAPEEPRYGIGVIRVGGVR